MHVDEQQHKQIYAYFYTINYFRSKREREGECRTLFRYQQMCNTLLSLRVLWTYIWEEEGEGGGDEYPSFIDLYVRIHLIYNGRKIRRWSTY